jgi:hypothetical protein
MVFTLKMASAVFAEVLEGFKQTTRLKPESASYAFDTGRGNFGARS